MSKERRKDILFTELFRAKSLDGLILPDRIKNDLSNGLTQNLLLYGPQGTSKTTIALIMSNGYDTLKLNGSSDNGIDVVRDQIVNFAESISLDGGREKIKVIFIDECDGLTTNAWDALRQTIERYASNTRFICTCNKIDKIPGPIQSRFHMIPVYPINKAEEEMMFNGYCGLVGQILTHCEIAYEPETLQEFVRNSFPDMRSILNSVQTLYNQEAASLDKDSLVRTFDAGDLFQLIMQGGDPIENYKFITSNYATNQEDAMLAVSKQFVDFLKMNYPEQSQKVPMVIITIAEYMDQLPRAIDKMIVLLACVFKLQYIIHTQQ